MAYAAGLEDTQSQAKGPLDDALTDFQDPKGASTVDRDVDARFEPGDARISASGFCNPSEAAEYVAEMGSGD